MKNNIRNANWFVFISFKRDESTSSISGWSMKDKENEALAEILAEFITTKSISGYTITYDRCIDLREQLNK